MLTIILALLLSAPATAQTRTSDQSHKRAVNSTAKMSDSELEKKIRARFAGSKINEDHFEVHVQGGVATITGKTDVIQHKGTATRMTNNAGVSAVVNKIQVSQAAKDRANANLSKGRRRAQVQRDGRTQRGARFSVPR